jgi:ABC-type nitrate/sulfonate/bicarbonate transport system ATPase subunit
MSVLTARGAGVRHRRRWLFRDLDVTVEAGELVAVVGPPGSGRTTLLLALANRFRLSAGKVTLSGTAVLGYVPDVEGPEPVFTVAEHVRERLALLGRHRSEAAGIPLHGLDPAARGRDLTPYQKQVLGLVLAGLSRPEVVALDGLDAGLDTAEQAGLWRLLAEFTAAGTAVLVTAREVDPARVTTVVRLGSPTEVRPPEPTRPAQETEWSSPTGTQPATEPDPAEAARESGRVGGGGAQVRSVEAGRVSGRADEDDVSRHEPPPTGSARSGAAHGVPEDEPAADDGAGTTPAAEAVEPAEPNGEKS